MSSVAVEYETIQRALPVCLPPWQENPYRLVSLLEMLEFAAHHYITLSHQIGRITTLIDISRQSDQPFESIDNERVREAFVKSEGAKVYALDAVKATASTLYEECIELGLSPDFSSVRPTCTWRCSESKNWER